MRDICRGVIRYQNCVLRRFVDSFSFRLAFGFHHLFLNMRDGLLLERIISLDSVVRLDVADIWLASISTRTDVAEAATGR